jgi:hypothetical protein
MRAVSSRGARWAVMGALALVLTACGGGGGVTAVTPAEDSTAPATAASADVRSGTYTLLAADTREYSLALDFDARTWHLTGNGVDQGGAVTRQGDTWFFEPGNASGTSGASTTRFQVATDTIVGELALPSGTVPFVAPRKFLNTVAEAAGTYNFLGRTIDTAGGAPNTTIQQAEITADGRLRVCADAVIYDLPRCPGGSMDTGTLAVSGDLFTATFPEGKMPFRVARVGEDKVFVRASPSVGTLRRFVIGVPATDSFSGDTFAGATTDPAWGTFTISGGTFTSAGKAPDGADLTQGGTEVSAGFVPGIRLITTTSSGSFFAVRSSELGVMVAAQGNAAAPAFEAVGRKQ